MMDFLNFIPIYLSESLGLSASVASMAGTSFPIGMFVALIVSGFLYDRFSKRQLAICLTTLLMIGISCVLCLWGMDLAPKAYRVPFSITCLFVLGFSISPSVLCPHERFFCLLWWTTLGVSRLVHRYFWVRRARWSLISSAGPSLNIMGGILFLVDSRSLAR